MSVEPAVPLLSLSPTEARKRQAEGPTETFRTLSKSPSEVGASVRWDRYHVRAEVT